MKVLFFTTLLAMLVQPALVLAATEKAPPEQCYTRQDLLARMPGFLHRVHFKEGAIVKRGDVVAELDGRLIATARKEAKAALDAANATLALAEDGHERMTKLKGSDAVSEQEIFVTKIKVEQARAATDQAKAVYERTRIQAEDAIIRAAINGKVLGLPHVLGLYVQAGQSLGRIEVEGDLCQSIN